MPATVNIAISNINRGPRTIVAASPTLSLSAPRLPHSLSQLSASPTLPLPPTTLPRCRQRRATQLSSIAPPPTAARAGRRRRLHPPPPPRILHERRRRGARVSNPVSSSPSSSPSPSSSLHLPHSSLFLSPDPATVTSSSTDPAAATSSPTDLAAAPSSSVDLAVERPDPAVDLHHGHDAGIHHGHDAGTSTTAGEDASARRPPSTTARRDPRGGTGIREEASAWSPASDWRGGGGPAVASACPAGYSRDAGARPAAPLLPPRAAWIYGRGKPRSVAGGLENGLAGGLLVFLFF